MSGTALKLIAILSMLIDHVGAVFFPEMQWMRCIGRIAMPVFAFCTAEGFSHTRSRKRYLINLLAFAFLSEVPFDLAFSGRLEFSHQNILFSFVLSVAALMVYDRITAVRSVQETGVFHRFLGLFSVFVFAILTLLLKTDYSPFAVLAVFLFYIFKDQKQPIRALAGVGFLAVTRTTGMYAWTGLSLIPLLFYNGQRGRGLKWLFYLFYPAHLLVLYLIREL